MKMWTMEDRIKGEQTGYSAHSNQALQFQLDSLTILDYKN